MVLEMGLLAFAKLVDMRVVYNSGGVDKVLRLSPLIGYDDWTMIGVDD